MRGLAAIALALVLLLAPTSQAAPKGPKPMKIKLLARGEAFCPTAALVSGGIIIAAGRCYTLFVFRDNRGTFLAFAAPAAGIPPGQIVRLGTPAGVKVKGRFLYVVPIRTTVGLAPVDSIVLVPARVEDFGARLTIVLANSNVSVIFQVRL